MSTYSDIEMLLDNKRASVVAVILTVMVPVYVICHIAQVLWLLLPPELFRSLHLCFSVIFLSLLGVQAAGNKLAAISSAVLAGISVTVLFYIFLSHESLINDRLFGPSQWDLVVGLALLVSVFLTASGVWGWIIPALGVAALLYGSFGYVFSSNLLFHSGMTFERLMSYTSIPYFQGMLGSMTGLSGSLIFIFMLFAGLLKATGGIDFVLGLATRMGGDGRGGPAKVAVIGSGIMGMISGSTVANVASTGTITIPLMTKHGFKPEEAGAIEAVASTGGQFMPPVMGLTAFLIVGMTGTSYTSVMIAAVIPALLFYLNLLTAVHLSASTSQLESTSSPSTTSGSDAVPLQTEVAQFAHLIAAVVLLTVLLFRQMPPSYAGIVSILFILLTETGKQLYLHRGNLMGGLNAAKDRFFAGALDGVNNGAQLAVIIAVIGIVVDMMTVTGLAQRLSHVVLAFENINLFVLLCLVAVSCLVFGLGMPTPAAYTLVAVLGAPALVAFGVDLLAAHMFVFFFANMSAITPPIALASLIASKIAGSSYTKTALHSVRLGLPGFLLPFLFVYYPELMLKGGSVWGICLTIVAVLLFFVTLNLALSRNRPFLTGLAGRLALIAVAAGLIYPDQRLQIASILILGGMLFFSRRQSV